MTDEREPRYGEPRFGTEDLRDTLLALSTMPETLGHLAAAQQSMARELTEFKKNTGQRLGQIDDKVAIQNGRVTKLEKLNEREAGAQDERDRSATRQVTAKHFWLGVVAVIVTLAGLVSQLPHNASPAHTSSAVQQHR